MSNIMPIIKALNGKEFTIPNYQRGYRWEKRQVNDLLNDIFDFNIKIIKQIITNEKEMYCLQPLVIQNKEEKRDVIDGQQRLTTIFLILSYINSLALGNLEECKFNLSYQSRDKSADFLEKISKNINDRDPESPSNHYLDCIDYYHIYMVYSIIKDWFEKRFGDDGKKTFKVALKVDGNEIDKEISIKVFYDNLINRVGFIYFEVDDEKQAMEAFSNLNEGKIPLTNAELIKAMFLNRSNFIGSNSTLNIRQQNIALEWDMIENNLHNDEFWLFIYPSKNYKKPTRIDYLFDIICENNRFELNTNQADYKEEIGSDSYRTFRYFIKAFNEKKEENEKKDEEELNEKWLLKLWDEVKEVYMVLNEWYRDYKMYHYIGYLISITQGEKDAISLINELVDLWLGGKKVKSGVDSIEEEIIKRITENLSQKKWIDDWKKTVFDNGDNGDYTTTEKKTDCRELLLLHNIETMVLRNKKLEDAKKYNLPNFTKFPFHLYKLEEWDIEHVFANAGDKEDIRSEIFYIAFLYKQDVLNRIKNDKNKSAIESLEKKIQAFLLNDVVVLFFNGKKIKDKKKTLSFLEKNLSEIIDEINDSFHEDNSYNKNTIGNYTLLDSTTNRSYGNNIFPIKRIFILEKEEGKAPDLKKCKLKKKPDNDKDGNPIEIPDIEIEYKDVTAFIPPCTRDLFTKKNTQITDEMFKWTQTDYESYIEDIATKLQKFFPKN